MLPALLLMATIWPATAFAQAGLSQDASSSQEGRPLPQPGTANQPTIVTADEAIAMDRARLRNVVGTACTQGLLDSEVVVCGRREGIQRYRVPAADPVAGAAMRSRPGDAQLYAMEANDQRCSPVGRDQQCGGGLDLIGIGFTIVRGIARALANRD
jgi:hypothetical protein